MPADFVAQWNKHVERVESGLLNVRRSSAISLMPIVERVAGKPTVLNVHMDLNNTVTLVLTADSNAAVREDTAVLQTLTLKKNTPPVTIDGVEFTFAETGHAAYLEIYEKTEYFSRIRLSLSSFTLSPVFPKFRELHTALRNLSGKEVDKEWDTFVGVSSRMDSYKPTVASPDFYLELVYENRSMARDAVWLMTLVAGAPPGAQAGNFPVQVTHSPFSISRFGKPVIDPEAGEIQAQWLSNDPEGAQWRFAVETVALQFPPQAIGEAMERGQRFWGAGQASPIDDAKPVQQRFSRCTTLTVRPSRLPRRYTVHPVDLFSTLKDAQLERMTTEVGYPLELTYARTERSTQTVVISEVGAMMGRPTIALAPVVTTTQSVPGWLFDALSDGLARWCAAQMKQGLALRDTYVLLRRQHLANRATFSNRLAVFVLKDAAHADKPLNLIEDLSAQLRSTNEGAGPVYPLAIDRLPEGFDQEPWVSAFLGAPGNVDNARRLPIGLLYTVEFASELRGVLRNPVTDSVVLTDLSLSALGASGNVKASFDNDRTTFEISSSDGQAWRIVKSRIGRIAAAWNRARHVVVYGRSTVPSRQFLDEQGSAAHQGRPLLRKIEEYIEIIEPNRIFSAEGSSASNKCGCLHSFCFATQRIYVNGAWGRDLDDHSGYQIPLYNPDDSSGFYVKPWLGPVAFDANEALVNHWHEHPQDVYFYSNSEKDTHSDPDQWPAVAGVDYQTKPTFTNAAPAVSASFLLGRKIVPDYTLAVVEDPRFSMRVTPQGQANIAHGRSDKGLLAALQTVHIERTSATSRVDLQSPDFPQADANNLRQAVGDAAEARSIEAVVNSLLKDIQSLRTFINAGDCDTFKARLKAQIDLAFGDAEKSVTQVSERAGKLTTQADALADAQIKSFEHWLDQTLNGAGFKAAVRDLADQQLQTLRQLVDQLDPANPANFEVMKVFLRQELAALNASVLRLIDPLRGIGRTLHRYASVVDRALAGRPLVSAIADARTTIDTFLNGVPAEQRQAIEGWIAPTRQTLDALVQLIGPIKQQLDAVQRHNSQVVLGALAMCLRQWVVEGETTLHDASKALEDFATQINGIEVDKSLRGAYERSLKPLLETLSLRASGFEQAAKETCIPLYHAAKAVVGLRQTLIKRTPGTWVTLKRVKQQLDVIDPSGAVADIQLAVRELDNRIGNLQDYCTGKTDPSFPGQYDAAFSQLDTVIRSTVADLKARLVIIKTDAMTAIEGGKTGVINALTSKKIELYALVDALDCTALDAFQAFSKSMQASIEQTTANLRDQMTASAEALMNEVTQHYAEAASKVAEALPGALGGASAALKSIRMLIEPPQIPHFSINTRQIECIFDDISTQIQTSPFVARLHELEGGIRDLGMALPVQGFQDSLKMLQLKGNRFGDVIKQAGIDFESLLKKFQLPTLPESAIRFSHQVDAQKRTASARVDIDHTFASTEQLFDIAGFSMDVRKPRLQANSRVEASESQTVTRTQARFGGDWIMNFGGQPLVTFRDANVQYSDSGGFTFDLDPRNVQPHPALLFITQVFQAKMPKLPEGVKIEKDSAGQPIGVSMAQESTVGPYEFGSLSIGEATIKSAFAVRVVNGQMSVVSAFDLGTSKSPVFMQVGPYGGGGWLNARAGLEPQGANKELAVNYVASMAVSVGSTRSFTLASVATGSYAIRLYLEATLSSNGGSRVAVGLMVNGSARLLGYLNAYLSLALEVEHSGGSMQGRGRIDVEIEICWCYSVRISRSVKQSI